MNSEDSVIRLAYQAVNLTPSQEKIRRGEMKKTYNPAHTAPQLNRVITHLQGQRDLEWARQRARDIVLDAEAVRFVDRLQTWTDLRHFLATLSLFLKTTETKERRAMRSYQDRNTLHLAPADVVERGWRLTRDVKWRREYNRNKVTRLAGRVRGARTKWECLAVLAQYYPLRGVPQDFINRLVAELEELDVPSFQAVVNQALVFYAADDIRAHPLSNSQPSVAH